MYFSDYGIPFNDDVIGDPYNLEYDICHGTKNIFCMFVQILIWMPTGKYVHNMFTSKYNKFINSQ